LGSFEPPSRHSPERLSSAPLSMADVSKADAGRVIENSRLLTKPREREPQGLKPNVSCAFNAVLKHCSTHCQTIRAGKMPTLR
jgi:hypothetical protein